VQQVKTAAFSNGGGNADRSRQAAEQQRKRNESAMRARRRVRNGRQAQAGSSSRQAGRCTACIQAGRQEQAAGENPTQNVRAEPKRVNDINRGKKTDPETAKPNGRQAVAAAWRQNGAEVRGPRGKNGAAETAGRVAAGRRQ